MDKRLLAVAVAGALAAPAFEISRRSDDYGPGLSWRGGRGGVRQRCNRVKDNRIAAYKRQRAANRLRRKLEARRG